MGPDDQNTQDNKEELVGALHKDSRLPQLRTYQGDIAKFIKTKDQSAMSIALKEKEAKEKKEKEKWLKKQREEEEKKQKEAEKKRAEDREYQEREKKRRKEQEETRRQEEKVRAEQAVEEAEEERQRKLQEEEARRQMEEMEAEAKRIREEASEKARELQLQTEEGRKVEKARIEQEARDKVAGMPPQPTLNAEAAVDELARELEAQLESEKELKEKEEKERAAQIQKLQHIAVQEAPTESRVASNMVTIVLSLFLLAGSLVVAGYAYLWRDIDTPVVPENYGPLIRPDEKMVVEAGSLTPASLKDELAVARKNIKEGKITEVKLTDGSLQRELGMAEAAEKLGLHMPASLARSLGPDYILGVYGDPAPAARGSLFLIFRETDYGIAFRDMLEWEKTLYQDLQPLLTEAPSAASSAGGFRDYILSNKDTRAILAGANKVRLLYTFLDKNTILITESGASLKGLLDAYATRNLVR